MSLKRRFSVAAGTLAATIAGLAFSTAPALGATCPNEQLRGGYSRYLPDCRAYEQASPVDKNGANVKGGVNEVQAAADGDGITFLPISGISGNTGAGVFPLSYAVRGPSGWSTRGMLPPASLGVDGVRGWSEDLSEILGGASEIATGEADILLDDTATGSLETIFPYSSEVGISMLAGTAAEGSLVMFESEGQLLPNAAAGKRNVYVWDRKTGTLSLVDVLPGGEAPPGGAFAGAYDWAFTANPSQAGIDNGGGVLGGYYAEQTHTISADGGRAFFTAGETGQIYARSNPAGSSPTTAQVSASQKTNGSGPGGTDSDGPQPAAFMDATPDGSDVFFTSSEELTNDASTGPIAAIGRTGLDGSGLEGSFIPVIANDIAVDGSHVFWTDTSAGMIGRANIDGTGVEPEWITGVENPQGIAVDGSHVYWTADGDGANGEGAVGRAQIDGADVEASFITGADNPQGIAVNAEHVYWANAGTTLATRRIGRAEIDGSSPNESFINPGAGSIASGIALDASYIYWTIPTKNTIGRAALGGSPVTTAFIAGASTPQGIAVDASHIYWANAGTSAIGRASVAGTEIEESFITDATGAQGVAVDASHLYFAGNGADKGNDLYRYEVASGDLTDLTPDAADPDGAEVKGVLGASEDGSYVYFVANAALAPGATQGDCSGYPASSSFNFTGVCNLYLWHEGETTFIAPLDPAGQIAQSDAADWLPNSRTEPAREENSARVSSDGRTLLFRSRERLTAYENEGVPELYLYRVSAPGQLTCVSCDPDGAAPPGEAGLQSINDGFGSETYPSKLTRNLSASGNQVFFESSARLLASDTDGVRDVYEWEADGAGSCTSEIENGGCLYLISTGVSAQPSYFADASKNGDDAFFFTSQPLVGQDTDEVVDVYDASVNGGLSSQSPVPLNPCDGEECKSTPASPVSLQAPGTATFSGSGNLKAPAAKHVSGHRGKSGAKTKRRAAKRRRAARLRSCRDKHKRSNRQACVKRLRRRAKRTNANGRA